MSYFLLTQDRFDEYQAMREANLANAKDMADFASTIATSEDFAVERGIDSAVVTVAGILTKRPDFWAWLTAGNTAYSELIPALKELDEDETVSKVQINFDSPGGSVDGMRDAIMAIRGMKTPTVGVACGLTASAAFILFSQCDQRVAANDASLLGSMGVVQQFRVRKDVVAVTNTDSQKKIPDVTTESGKADVVAELDKLYNFYGAFVADRMDITVAQLPEKTDHGAVMLAGEALERGMVDSIDDEGTIQTLSNEGPNGSGVNSSTFSKESVNMTVEQLKAEHRAECEAIHAEGLEAGVQQERLRVSAHVTSGVAFGAVDKALEAIKNGEEYTALTQAEYGAIQVAQNSQTAKKDGEQESADASNGAQDEPETPAQIEAKNTAKAKELFAAKLGGAK